LKQQPERCEFSPMTKLPQMMLKMIHKKSLQFSHYFISVIPYCRFLAQINSFSVYIRVSSWLKADMGVLETWVLVSRPVFTSLGLGTSES